MNTMTTDPTTLSLGSLNISERSISIKSDLDALCGEWELLSDGKTIPLKKRLSRAIAIIGSRAAKKAVVLVEPTSYPSQGYFVALRECRTNGYEYEVSMATESIIESLRVDSEEDLADMSEDKNVKLLNGLVSEALNRNAADIFIEIDEGDNFKASFDIDTEKVPYRDYSRKEVTGMMRYYYQTIADQETLQESIFSMESSQFATGDGIWEGQKLRLRYQSKPAFPEGIDFAIRLLKMSSGGGFTSISDLGVSSDQETLLLMVSRGEKGATVMIGPTASGKTTTIKVLLTTMLKNNPGLNIRSAESPPEYIIPGVRQYVVRESKGGSGHAFAETMKEILRMNPHIIFVGEVRGSETMDFFRKATESGHGVLTTTHANDAYGCFSRFESEGLDRQIFAQPANINALIYQQRLPVTCTVCGIDHADYDLDESIKKRLKLLKVDLSKVVHHNSEGCSSCGYRGTKGAIPSMEIVVPDTAALACVRDHDQIGFSKAWVKVCEVNGYGDAVETHFYHSLKLVASGVVSPEKFESKYTTINTIDLEQNCRVWKPGQEFEGV